MEAEILIEDLKKKMDKIHNSYILENKYSNHSMLNEELQVKLEIDNKKLKQCYMKKYFN